MSKQRPTRLSRLHRRLTVGMALAALAAFAAGAGIDAPTAGAGALLFLLLFRHPSRAFSVRLNLVWVVLATALFVWVLLMTFVVGGDILPPVLALLLVLLTGEAVKPLDSGNDLRLYVLSFALLMAGTAFYPGVQFGAALAAYIVLGVLSLMVGHLRREAERHGIADIPVGRPFLLTTAALSGLTVAMSGLVFLALPRLPGALLGQPARGAGAALVGFSDQLSLGQWGSRVSANPEVVLRVEFPGDEKPPTGNLYWRGHSYDQFDGVSWTRTERLPAPTLAREAYLSRWGGPPRRYTVYGTAPGTRLLFGLHPVISVQPESRVRPYLTRAGDLRYFGSDRPVFQGVSAAPRPPESVLRGARPWSLEPARAYLQLPRDTPRRVLSLADSLSEGQTTRYEKVAATLAWFRRGFGYTLDLPDSPREATLEHFLFERREGHCEYFSTAMAVLLRAAGVPARNVTGFLGGDWNDFGSYLAVTQNQAHSWVEVWFPDLGWVPFDPTPAGSADGGAGGAGAMVWPGLFFLDMVQHRWYQWVLNYDLGSQRDLFRGARDLFSELGWGGGRAGEGAPGRTVEWMIPLVAGGVALWLLLRARRQPLPPESRLYQRLRRAYQRAGFGVPEMVPPLGFLGALESSRAPGREAAAEVVRMYLAARFGRMKVDRQKMKEAVREASRAVAKSPPPSAPAPTAAPGRGGRSRP
ncbi:MAG: transglutaminaseTgpA domain-containing protein [Longimicrobiaceae bacterium]